MNGLSAVHAQNVAAVRQGQKLAGEAVGQDEVFQHALSVHLQLPQGIQMGAHVDIRQGKAAIKAGKMLIQRFSRLLRRAVHGAGAVHCAGGAGNDHALPALQPFLQLQTVEKGVLRGYMAAGQK